MSLAYPSFRHENISDDFVEDGGNELLERSAALKVY
jgi:hypothetical protein